MGQPRVTKAVCCIEPNLGLVLTLQLTNSGTLGKFPKLSLPPLPYVKLESKKKYSTHPFQDR